ncbi:GYDIA family GHMP kinase [Zeaxanthinibacter enoshimensis]|uniref:Mevalonate kinase n=1 Tax=Zeaxanthinibacter enoshimensis TaxID=392009 RepID=A0A4R6TNY6_9FLAO|nr:GYDIA family GHMP kinase [Zeaxanthinibacter enoshimensis]TDQ33312.1 mevalonate kinase [Zeaxanthinibacter enoshimensis]
MKNKFYSHGKLLVTGEYAVLDGALSLALPTRYGQVMEVEETENPVLLWESRDELDQVWFKTEIPLPLQDPETPGKGATTETELTLRKLLQAVEHQRPGFFSAAKGYRVVCQLGFPRDWGLGSSSTLVNNIAQWTGTDPYKLLSMSFGGSGYDIACAKHASPILYHRAGTDPTVKTVDFNPPFRDSLYFVHLNKKQNSREGIRRYRESQADKSGLVRELSELTHRVVEAKTLQEFSAYMVKHEELISNTIGLPTVKESLFPDYSGSIKSLGAWGGDFVLAAGGPETPAYFSNKGYKTIVPFREMIL